MDIDKLIEGIEALREFKADVDARQPNELVIVPPTQPAQRVREFLVYVAGAGSAWAKAKVTTYPMPGGASMYLASTPKILTHGTAVVVVAEDLEGNLSLPWPIASDGDANVPADEASPPVVTPEQEKDYANARACLDRILPALAEVGRILAADETVKPRRKKRLLREINHAAGHLLQQLESLLPDEE